MDSSKFPPRDQLRRVIGSCDLCLVIGDRITFTQFCHAGRTAVARLGVSEAASSLQSFIQSSNFIDEKTLLGSQILDSHFGREIKY